MPSPPGAIVVGVMLTDAVTERLDMLKERTGAKAYFIDCPFNRAANFGDDVKIAVANNIEKRFGPTPTTFYDALNKGRVPVVTNALNKIVTAKEFDRLKTSVGWPDVGQMRVEDKPKMNVWDNLVRGIHFQSSHIHV